MMSDGDPPMDPSGNHSPNPDVVEPEVLNKDDTQEVEEGRPESDLGNSDYISLSSSENQTHSRMTSPADSDSEFIDAQENVEKEKCIDIIVKISPNSHTFMEDVIEECLDMMDTFVKIGESKEINQKEQFRGVSHKENENENKQCEDTKQTYNEIPSGSTEKKVHNNDPEENFQLDMEKDGYQLGGTLSMTTVVDGNGFTIGNDEENLAIKEDELKISETNINIKEIVSKLEMPHELEKGITLQIDADEVAENITKRFMNFEPKSVSKSNIFDKSEKLLHTLSTLQVPKYNFIKNEGENPPEIESSETDIANETNEKPPEIDASDFEQDLLSPPEQKVSVKDQIKIYESQEKLTGKDTIQKSPSKEYSDQKAIEIPEEATKEPSDFQDDETTQEKITIVEEGKIFMDEITPETDATENTTEEPKTHNERIQERNLTENLEHSDDLKPLTYLNEVEFEEAKMQSENEENETQTNEKQTEKFPEVIEEETLISENQTKIKHEQKMQIENFPNETEIDNDITPNEIDKKYEEISPKMELKQDECEDPTDSFGPKEQLEMNDDLPESDELKTDCENLKVDSDELKKQFESESNMENIEETNPEIWENPKHDQIEDKNNKESPINESFDLKNQLEISNKETNETSEDPKQVLDQKEEKNPNENVDNEENVMKNSTFSELNREEKTPVIENQTEVDFYGQKGMKESKNNNESDEKVENKIDCREEETSVNEKLKEVDTHFEDNTENPSRTLFNELDPKEENSINENQTNDSHDQKIQLEKDQNKTEEFSENPTEIDSHDPLEKDPNEIENRKNYIETSTDKQDRTDIDPNILENMTKSSEENIYEKNFNENYLEYKNKILNENLNIIPGKLELLQKELTDKTSKFEKSIYGGTFEEYNKKIEELYFLRKKESMQLIEYSPEPLLLKLPQQIYDGIEEEGEKFQVDSDSKTCVLDLNLSMKQQINELIENLEESPTQVNELEKEFSEIDSVETIHVNENSKPQEPHHSEMKTSSSAYLITYISEPESLQGSTSNPEKKELEGLDDSILKEVAKKEIIKRLDEILDEDIEKSVDVEVENETIENSKMIEIEAGIKIENDKNIPQLIPDSKVEETIDDEKSHTALGTPLSTNYGKNMSRSITVSRRAKSPSDKPNQQLLRNPKLNLSVKNSSIRRRLSPSKPQSPGESENAELLKATSSKTEENCSGNKGTLENETSEASALPKKSSPTMKTSSLMTRFNLQLDRYHKEVSEFEKLKINIKNIIKNLTTVHGELATNGTEDLPQLPQDIFEKSNDNQESIKQEEENKKLKESIKKKTGEIDQLKKQLYSFKEDMKHLEEKINMNDMRKSEERDKNTRLMSQFSNMKEQLERLTKEKNEIEQKKNKDLEQLRIRLKGEAKKREQVEKSVEENINQIEKLKLEKEELKLQYLDLNNTISEKTQKVEKYKNEVKGKKIELEEINREVNELKESLEKQKEFICVLQIDLDKTNNELNKSSKRELDLSEMLNQKDEVYGAMLQKEKSSKQALVDFICDMSSLSEYKISSNSRNMLYEGKETHQILKEIKNEMENYINEKNQNLLKREKTINSLKMDLKERQNLLDVFQSSELDKSDPEVKEPLKPDADVRSMTAKELIELMENKKQAIERMENEIQSLHNIHSYCGMRRSLLETKITDLEHLLRDYQY